LTLTERLRHANMAVKGDNMETGSGLLQQLQSRRQE